MQARNRADGISICIPNWNHRNYLFRCVRCALSTARELARHDVACEVLIFDDGSRDGSQRLILRMAFLDPTGTLHAIEGRVNQGLGAMRNLSLVEARFKWVCFLDADNELEPENLIYFYKSAKETGAALVYGNILVQDKGPDGQIVGMISNDVVHDDILEINHIDAMAVVDAEQALDIGGYTDSRMMAEDWEFMLHLAAEERQVVFLPITLGRYFLQPHSLGCERSDVDHRRTRRMYNQRKVGFPSGFQPRVYHPAVGYLV